jgi:hypothetical protein
MFAFIILIMNCCTNGKTAAEVPDSTYTPSATMLINAEESSIVPTLIPNTETQSPVVAESTAKAPSKISPNFYQSFTAQNNPLALFSHTANGAFKWIKEEGVIEVEVVNQPLGEYFCTFEPKGVPFPKGIMRIEAKVNYFSGDEGTYVGFYTFCHEAMYGFWIDDNYIKYSHNGGMKDVTILPDRSQDWHVLTIDWGSSIFFYVDGILVTDQSVKDLQCDIYPSDVRFGIFVPQGKSATGLFEEVNVVAKE